jgi:hypothetical protein
MINHFLDLHTEHTPEERCSELGDALARNRESLPPPLPHLSPIRHCHCPNSSHLLSRLLTPGSWICFLKPNKVQETFSL